MFYAVIHNPSHYHPAHGGAECGCSNDSNAPQLVAYHTRQDREAAVGQAVRRNRYGDIAEFTVVEPVGSTEAVQRFGRKALKLAAEAAEILHQERTAIAREIVAEHKRRNDHGIDTFGGFKWVCRCGMVFDQADSQEGNYKAASEHLFST